MKFEGECFCGGAYYSGWARNSESDEPVWVELAYKDLSLGIALADMEEPRGCGFYLPIPAGALDDADLLEVRIANTGHILAENCGLGGEEQENVLEGQFVVDRGLCLSGWARDRDDASRPVRLFGIVDEKKVATALACERRWRPEGADRRGFVMYLPQSLADGEEHLVHVSDEKNRELPGSPARIRILPSHVSEWLDAKKAISPQDKKIIVEYLRRLEKRLPGAISLQEYEYWKAAFPAPKVDAKIKCSIALPYCQRRNFLNGQKAINLDTSSATPEYVLLASGEEKFHSYAIAHMIAAMRAKNADAIYADGEDGNGRPVFRTAWDKIAFWHKDNLGPILARYALLEQAGIDGKESMAAARLKILMAADKLGGVAHLPQILSAEPNQAAEAGRLDALRDCLEVQCPGAVVEEKGECGIRIHFPAPADALVSIIIPTRDHAAMLRRCVESLEKTDWADYEVIVVDNGSVEEDALDLLVSLSDRPNFKVIPYPGVFNFSRINNMAARHAAGGLLCFLNNDTEILSPHWLREMISILCAECLNAGCVGAKLLWPNRLVQHGGVVVGVHGLAGHIGNQWLEDDPGYLGRNQMPVQCSAVTAACMLTPRDFFLELGGFDDRDFAVNFNDVDYCMRARQRGKNIYWTPDALLLHHESASRGQEKDSASRSRVKKEMSKLGNKWGAYLDPFYNPNLPLSTVIEPFEGLAFPPRPRNVR